MGLYEKMKAMVDNWKDGEHILSRGKSMDYPYIYGTRDKIIIHDQKIVYRLWDTDIVVYDKALGYLILDTGGWNTKTTKEKMNTMLKLLGVPYHVEGRYETRRTQAGEWHLIGKDKTIPFVSENSYTAIFQLGKEE